ncbi:hypothetical protein LA6_000268 [Marinibacterium anthonyi]|nr:hypothetical protein LA6_000268 [Marinibacterium anthonyi]
MEHRPCLRPDAGTTPGPAVTGGAFLLSCPTRGTCRRVWDFNGLQRRIYHFLGIGTVWRCCAFCRAGGAGGARGMRYLGQEEAGGRESPMPCASGGRVLPVRGGIWGCFVFGACQGGRGRGKEIDGLVGEPAAIGAIGWRMGTGAGGAFAIKLRPRPAGGCGRCCRPSRGGSVVRWCRAGRGIGQGERAGSPPWGMRSVRR